MIAPNHYVGDSLNMTHYHEYIMCSTIAKGMELMCISQR